MEETYQEMVLRSRGEQLERTQKSLHEAREEIAKLTEDKKSLWETIEQYREMHERRRLIHSDMEARAIQAEQEVQIIQNEMINGKYEIDRLTEERNALLEGLKWITDHKPKSLNENDIYTAYDEVRIRARSIIAKIDGK